MQSGRELLARYANGGNIAVRLVLGPRDERSRCWRAYAVNRTSDSSIRHERIAPGRGVRSQ